MFCHLCIFLLPLCFLSICAIPHLIFHRSVSYSRSSVMSAVFTHSRHPSSLTRPPPDWQVQVASQRALFLCKWVMGGGRSSVMSSLLVTRGKRNNYFHRLSRVSRLYLLIQMILVYRSYFLKATKGNPLFFFFFLGRASLPGNFMLTVKSLLYFCTDWKERLAAWICNICQVWLCIYFK